MEKIKLIILTAESGNSDADPPPCLNGTQGRTYLDKMNGPGPMCLSIDVDMSGVEISGLGGRRAPTCPGAKLHAHKQLAVSIAVPAGKGRGRWLSSDGAILCRSVDDSRVMSGKWRRRKQGHRGKIRVWQAIL